MPWAHIDHEGNLRETVAVQILLHVESVGWVDPDDVAALQAGDLDADGVLTIARLQPEPPPGTVRTAPPWTCYLED